jgi:hypothetical protein
MCKKLEDFHWTSVWDLTLASPSASRDEAAQFAPAKPADKQATGNVTVESAQAGFLGLVSRSAVAAAPQNQLVGVRSGVVPAGYQAPADSAAMARPAVDGIGQSTTGTVHSAADAFCALQDRLRQLGATYYLLESWGSEQQMYRFYCKMAIGGSADYTRYFEATSADPLQAMLDVVRQVEAWKEGGRAKAEGGGTAKGP